MEERKGFAFAGEESIPPKGMFKPWRFGTGLKPSSQANVSDDWLICSITVDSPPLRLCGTVRRNGVTYTRSPDCGTSSWSHTLNLSIVLIFMSLDVLSVSDAHVS